MESWVDPSDFLSQSLTLMEKVDPFFCYEMYWELLNLQWSLSCKGGWIGILSQTDMGLNLHMDKYTTIIRHLFFFFSILHTPLYMTFSLTLSLNSCGSLNLCWCWTLFLIFFYFLKIITTSAWSPSYGGEFLWNFLLRGVLTALLVMVVGLYSCIPLTEKYFCCLFSVDCLFSSSIQLFSCSHYFLASYISFFLTYKPDQLGWNIRQASFRCFMPLLHISYVLNDEKHPIKSSLTFIVFELQIPIFSLDINLISC